MPLEKNWKKITINYPHWNYPIDLLQIQVMVSIHLKSMHKSKKSCSFLLFLKIKNFSNYGALNKEWRPSNKREWSCKPLTHLDEWNPHKNWKNRKHLLSHAMEAPRAQWTNGWLGLGEEEGELIYSGHVSTGWRHQPVLNFLGAI